MDIGGGLIGNGLTVNLTDPSESWIMAGEMNLSGLAIAAFPITRMAGSQMDVYGDLGVQHYVRVNASTSFESGSNLTFATTTASLQMMGNTRIAAGAEFAGGGILENGTTGSMLLANGALLADAALHNRGLLLIGSSPGTATVEAFENLASGTWLVEIGGHLPGTEFDRLLAGSGAVLDGLLEVDLIDAGDGLFLPEVGDTFTILTSPGGVLGAFTNSPVSHAAGQQFHWDVLYEPNDVILQLVNITAVPEPTSLALLVVGSLAMLRRRNSALAHAG